MFLWLYINFSEAMQYAMNRPKLLMPRIQKYHVLFSYFTQENQWHFSNINVTFLNLEADMSTAECFV